VFDYILSILVNIINYWRGDGRNSYFYLRKNVFVLCSGLLSAWNKPTILTKQIKTWNYNSRNYSHETSHSRMLAFPFPSMTYSFHWSNLISFPKGATTWQRADFGCETWDREKEHNVSPNARWNTGFYNENEMLCLVKKGTMKLYIVRTHHIRQHTITHVP